MTSRSSSLLCSSQVSLSVSFSLCLSLPRRSCRPFFHHHLTPSPYPYPDPPNPRRSTHMFRFSFCLSLFLFPVVHHFYIPYSERFFFFFWLFTSQIYQKELHIHINTTYSQRICFRFSNFSTRERRTVAGQIKHLIISVNIFVSVIFRVVSSTVIITPLLYIQLLSLSILFLSLSLFSRSLQLLFLHWQIYFIFCYKLFIFSATPPMIRRWKFCKK